MPQDPWSRFDSIFSIEEEAGDDSWDRFDSIFSTEPAESDLDRVAEVREGAAAARASTATPSEPTTGPLAGVVPDEATMRHREVDRALQVPTVHERLTGGPSIEEQYRRHRDRFKEALARHLTPEPTFTLPGEEPEEVPEGASLESRQRLAAEQFPYLSKVVEGGVQSGAGGFVEALGGVLQAEAADLGGGPNRVPLLPRQRELIERGTEKTAPVREAISGVGESVEEKGREIREGATVPLSVETGPTWQPFNPEWWASRGTEVLTQFGGQMGLAAATRGRSVPAQLAAFTAPVGVLEGGHSYIQTRDQLKEQGVPEEEAERRAAETAAAAAIGSAALEAVPGAAILFNRLPGAAQVFLEGLQKRVPGRKGRALTGGLTEGGQETAQEAWQDVVEYAQTEDPETFAQWRQRYAAAGSLGGMAGTVAGGVVTPRDPGDGGGSPSPLNVRQLTGPEAVGQARLRGPEPYRDVRERETRRARQQQAAEAAGQKAAEALRGEELPASEPVDAGQPVQPGEQIGPRGERQSDKVFALPVDEIERRPEQMQYKTEGIGEGGVSNRMKGVVKWDDDAAGTLAVWYDPEAETWVAVDGHHRHELAERLNEEGNPTAPERLNVAEIEAETAEDARAVGALKNIREGRGTVLDAAKYFRDTGMTEEELREEGVPLTEHTVKQGLAISKLHPGLFEAFRRKELPVQRAALIGDSGLSPAKQMDLWKQIKDRKSIRNDEIEQLISFAKEAEQGATEQETLFGTEEIEETNLMEKAEVAAYIDRQLGKRARTFKFASKQQRADLLEGAGVAAGVETGKAGKLGATSEQIRSVFNKLKSRSGQVSEILNDAANRLKEGEDASQVKQDALERIEQELRSFVGGEAQEGDSRGGEAREAGGGAAGERAAPEPSEGRLRGPDGDVEGLTDDEVIAARDYPQVSREEQGALAREIRLTAQRLKDADEDAVRRASAELADEVPEGATLIPIPSSTGDTRANRALAEALASRIDGEVVDVLRREPAGPPSERSQFVRRRSGRPGLPTEEITTTVEGEVGDLENAYLLDNVVASGATAESARRALGADLPVAAYAKQPDIESFREEEAAARADGKPDIVGAPLSDVLDHLRQNDRHADEFTVEVRQDVARLLAEDHTLSDEEIRSRIREEHPETDDLSDRQFRARYTLQVKRAVAGVNEAQRAPEEEGRLEGPQDEDEPPSDEDLEDLGQQTILERPAKYGSNLPARRPSDPAEMTWEQYHARLNPDDKWLEEHADTLDAEKMATFIRRGDHPQSLGTVRLRDGTRVELRRSEEPQKITRTDPETGKVLRDEEGYAKITHGGETKVSIAAFVGDQPIGYVSNPMGTTEVVVAKEHRGEGLGTALVDRWIAEKPFYPSGGFTPGGRATRRHAHRRHVTRRLQGVQEGRAEYLPEEERPDLRPAVRTDDGEVHMGEIGDMHIEIVQRALGDDTGTYGGRGLEGGYVDEEGNWLSRREAFEAITGQRPLLGGQSAEDLPGAREERRRRAEERLGRVEESRAQYDFGFGRRMGEEPPELLPAVRTGSGDVVVGEKGQIHAEIFMALPELTQQYVTPRDFGFVRAHDPETFLNRTEAQAVRQGADPSEVDPNVNQYRELDASELFDGPLSEEQRQKLGELYSVREDLARYGQGDMFGASDAPAEGGDQFSMDLGEESTEEAGLSESERKAQEIVDELRPKVKDDDASLTELQRYREALALLNRGDAQTEEETRLDARIRREEEGPDEDLGTMRLLEDMGEEHLEGTFGSVDEAEDVAEEAQQVEMSFGSSEDLPTVEQRLGEVRRAEEQQTYIDIRGKRIETSEDAYRLLHPFRDPRFEKSHVVFLDEDGRVLSHTMDSSGAINYVQYSKRWIYEAVQRARRLGADRVLFAHNHPSGDPDPSVADIRFSADLRRALHHEGVGFEGSLVLDHGTYGWMASKPNKAMSVDILRADMGEGDWTDQIGATVNSPSSAAEVLAGATAPDRVDVVYLSNQLEAVALEPHRPEAFENAAEWLPQRMRALGASRVLIGLDERHLHAEATQVVNDVVWQGELDLSGDVVDIVHYTVKKGQKLPAFSAREEGLLGHPEQPGKGRPVRRLFERGAEYGERAGPVSDDRPTGTLRGGDGGGGGRGDLGRFGDSEREQRWQDAKGLTSPSLLEKAREGLESLRGSFTRHFPHIDTSRGPRWAQTHDYLRQYESASEYAKARAFDLVTRVVEGLDSEQADTFTRLIVLPDLQKDIEEGLYDERPVPFYEGPEAEGLSPDRLEELEAEIAADLERFRTAAAQDPDIRAALDRRQDLIRPVTERLVEEGLLREEVLDDPRYYHRQVMKYADAMGDPKFVGTGSSDLRMKSKGFQREREGGGEFNTLYHEAEFEWLSQAFSLLERKRALDRIEHLWNAKGDFKKRAKIENRLRLGRQLLGGGEQGELFDYTPQELLEAARAALKPYRQQIAIANEELAELAEGGELDGGDYQHVVDALAGQYRLHQTTQEESLNRAAQAEEFRFEHPDWFRLLSHLVEQGGEGAVQAGSIFKAIRGREQHLEQELGSRYIDASANTRGSVDQLLELAPEGYTSWQPERGHHFYPALTIEERVLEEAAREGQMLDREDVREQLAMGGLKDVWFVPEEIAVTLDEFNVRGDQGPLGKFHRGAITTWKQWVLLNPVRVLKYNVNNMSGDADIAFAYDPRIMEQVPEAERLLRAFHGKRSQSRVADAASGDRLTREQEEELEDLIRRGVINSGLTIAEIPDISEAGVFQVFTDEDPGAFKKWVETYWNDVREATTYRENILRLAAYRYFLGRLEDGETDIYAASRQHEVDALSDRKAKAAKLSRELIGDYGNITESGQWVRENLIPFYSWLEINAPRYYRMLKNLPHEGDVDTTGRAGKLLGLAGKRTATKLGKFAVKAHLLAMAVFLWNWTRDREAAREILRNRRQLHIILGRREDGSIRSIRFEGALTDALEWFGLEDYPADLEDLVRGRADVFDKAAEAVKAPIEKLYQGALPFTKTAMETITGRSTYPFLFEEGKDFGFRTSPVRDRMEHSLNVPGWPVQDLYRFVTNKPAPPSTGPLDFAANQLLLYRTDPGEASYWQAKQLTVDFLKEQGREFPSITPTERSNALYYYKKAVKWGDEGAAEKWLNRYHELGGTEEGLQRSIERSAPLGSLPQKLEPAFLESLNERQRELVEQAREWYSANYRDAAKGPIGERGRRGGGRRLEGGKLPGRKLRSRRLQGRRP